MVNTAVIVIACGDIQNKCIWPSYENCSAGIDHDLIIVHRNNEFVPKKAAIYENKIFPNGELEYKAFGAYRYYFNKYKNEYDYFAFISDDVVLKRDNWLYDAILPLTLSEGIGFTASQIFNSGVNMYKYPHETHLRAPLWFAKTKALKKIDWEFVSDHDGEMRIAEQFTKVGYFGIQVGNKINLGYDCFEKDHITQLMELFYYNTLEKKYTVNEINEFEKIVNTEHVISSPYTHIGKRSIKQIEPYNGLICDLGIKIAKKYINVNTKDDSNIWNY